MDITKKISLELNLKETQIEAAIKLIDEGNTIPFIARYRKEATGYLTDADLRNLSDRLSYLRKLEERMNTVISSIDEQGKLTEELKNSILNAQTLSEVEDLYRPYKPKKKTRASIAKEKGLEPLAKYLVIGKKDRDLMEYAATFISEDKKVKTKEDALQGAEDIIAEMISDEPKYRKYIKGLINRVGLLTSKEIKKDEKDTYGQYADYKESIASIPAHRILAINRGEKEGCLKVDISFPEDVVFAYIARDYYDKNDFKDIMKITIEDALKRLIYPSVENEIRTDLFENAEDKSIMVFKKNLVALLMYPPLKNKVVLGFDPGFRTGCKYALVNANGIPLKVGVLKVTSNDTKEVESSKIELTKLLKDNKIDYIALGNGTASRESEEVIREIIETNKFPIKIFIVNESGASVYSASKLGEEEFLNLPVEKRSAISLARRIQDPLSELVKIEPKAIGVGQYQHDMDQTKLNNSLSGVVEDCVNKVGVNLNNASVSLLKYVSGINISLANNIYNYLKTNGRFNNRSELKKVAKMGPKAFEQCAGFLRIYDGTEPLDITSIHPESYDIAKKILKLFKIDLLKDGEVTKNEKLAGFNAKEFIEKLSLKVGEATLNDIVMEIKKPGRDIRDEVKIIELNNSVKDIKDLKVGMVLEGTVRNIMDFGMFVDINVHCDGLVHISELSNKFVKNISDLYTVNDVVKVKVISVDVNKKRIGLSIKQVNTK
jgi:uncharacterized protein